jgi:hypothetical protein
MPETVIDLTKSGSENITFRPSDGVPIRFSDAFLVGGTPEMFMLSFYQQEIPLFRGDIRDKTPENPEASCIARIALTPVGFVRILATMADKVGLVLTQKPVPPEEQQEAKK